MTSPSTTVRDRAVFTAATVAGTGAAAVTAPAELTWTVTLSVLGAFILAAVFSAAARKIGNSA